MAAPTTDRTSTIDLTEDTSRRSRHDRRPDAAFASRVATGDLGLALLRIVVGAVFVGHGAQKLFGWFGGDGLQGTGQFFESAGYRPGELLALLAGLAEFGGGIMLIVGLGTSFAGAALVATMAGATAVTADAGDNAFFAMNDGYEFQLVLTVVALALVLTGAGRFALDHGRVWDRAPVRLTLAVAGVIAGLVTVLVR